MNLLSRKCVYPTKFIYCACSLQHDVQGATAANVSLPEPGACVTFKGCSLGANRDIVVSTETPLVTNITTTKPSESGPFGAGDEIDVTVWFTEPVEALANVTKAPRLRYAFVILPFDNV